VAHVFKLRLVAFGIGRGFVDLIVIQNLTKLENCIRVVVVEPVLSLALVVLVLGMLDHSRFEVAL
jgi:hypothetical protein